jgi:hypothetical protein
LRNDHDKNSPPAKLALAQAEQYNCAAMWPQNLLAAALRA